MIKEQFINSLTTWLVTHGLLIVFIAAMAFLLLVITRIAIRKIANTLEKRQTDTEVSKRVETLAGIIRHVLSGVILVIMIIMVLGEFGVNLGPILAAAGILGLAVGFGAQSLVKDVISGFFILLENQIRVGDIVQIAGKGGLVEAINLRLVTIRDVSGNVHFVPNNQIDVVTNMSKEFSRYVFDIGVSYREDVDEVMETIKAVDEELRQDPEYGNDILEPMEVLGLDKFADSAVVLRARTTTKPNLQWKIGREFNRRLKRRFDERGIEIPFPHVTLYMGRDKADQAPPLQVEMQPPR